MIMRSNPIIIVDDEKVTLLTVETILNSAGFENIIKCENESSMWQAIKKYGADLIILDLIMPNSSGEEILNKLQQDHPDIPVIISTGVNALDTAVRCMRNGAYDYLLKPVEMERLVSSVRHAHEMHDLRLRYEILSASLMNNKLSNPENFQSIITVDPNMTAIFRYIEAVASSSNPILITGETGVGKELIAESIHNASDCTGKFVRVNVAGLDDNILSDTLFGHLSGAFTGAITRRKGLVEEAANGTLFLDEIGDLSIQSQVKLLRLLQEREFRPLGSDMIKPSTARIITATSRTIDDLNSSNTFRRDLYYRLKIHHIHIPPLRERKCDIQVLVKEFLKLASAEYKKPVPTVPQELFSLLNVWHFPGNIRELQALIFDAVVRHSGKVLSLESFKNTLNINNKNIKISRQQDDEKSLLTFSDRLPTIKEAISLLLDEAMQRSNDNKTLAAGLLGISRQAISQRLNKK